jgi:PadR family transcriptional regulator PadR
LGYEPVTSTLLQTTQRDRRVGGQPAVHTSRPFISRRQPVIGTSAPNQVDFYYFRSQMKPKRADTLGATAQLVLLALARASQNAYGVTIRREIEARTGRRISLGAIYPTLDRLEAKGLVSSYLCEPTAVRGGRSRRLYELEPAGADALRRAREELSSLWAGLKLPSRLGR